MSGTACRAPAVFLLIGQVWNLPLRSMFYWAGLEPAPAGVVLVSVGIVNNINLVIDWLDILIICTYYMEVD